MSASTLPAGGISLRGHAAADTMNPDHHVAKSAMLFKLSQSMLNDLRKAASGQGGLQFVTGKTPKLQLGSRSIDLGVSPDVFRNELYTSSSPTAFHFETVISHRAEVSADHASQSSTAAENASLATLQSQMEFLREEKKAKQTTISDSVLPELSRFEAAKRQKKGGLLGLHSSSGATSPSLSGAGTPRPGLAATSAPDDSVDRTKAMRTPIIHLLAMQPLSTSEITAQTHIPRAILDPILSKVATPSDGKWELMGKMYKELDVWSFQYKTQEDRQSAVDNAIRALDRQRIGKEDKLWQMLLPEEERGKGRMLSKLHLGAAPQPIRGLTPNWQPSPNPQTEDEEKAANTPRLGPSAAGSKASKAGAAKTGGAAMTKRLLSKDPKKAQKARAAEEAKEKRKREREAAATASDREAAPAGKRQKQGAGAGVGKVAPSKIKSAELVHSSDDEDDEGEEGEIIETPSHAGPKTNGAVKPAPSPKPKAKASMSSPDSSDEHVKPTSKAKSSAMAAKAKPSASTPLNKSTTTSSPALKASKPATTAFTKTTTGKATPSANNLPASTKAVNKSGLSPSKSHTRPPGPSPLGAARPRLASDVSDRSGIASRKGLKGGDTPKGLGITANGGAVNGTGARRRQDTVTSRESFTSTDGSSERAKVAGRVTSAARKGATAVTEAKTSGTLTHKGTPVRKAEAGTGSGPTKRKAATAEEDEGKATKHRKTDSGSSASTLTSDNAEAKMAPTTRAQKNGTNGKVNGKTTATANADVNGNTKSTAKPNPTPNDRPSTSPSDAALFSSSSSTKSPPHAETISFHQGVDLAQKFKEEYYPAYAKFYDELAEREATGGKVESGERRKLWEMHRRLEGIKGEIVRAAQREGS